MRLQLRAGRHYVTVSIGRHRPPRAHGLPLDSDGARLVLALTQQLSCRVLLGRNGTNTATGLYLLDTRGAVLGVEAPRRGRRAGLRPLAVAVVPDDPTVGISGQLEAVPQHGIGYAGSVSREQPEALAAIVARHYRPALDSSAPPWTPNTPWSEPSEPIV
ncbi:hypothetical protein [Streptomyces sp. NBC_00470]|uniref:hypothetical protein n=1 Tax=Streptomyces sp. NBC_00470 TaxID=2975753 RepID=UPI003246DE0A